ncbi:IS66 family insertion sequence element accessory protein TnpA [Marinagarivorans algicola]|uniref:IS66 family insertion sequence element accessory protein TnpA n=1 Tax=Marinagarivorans algicola TaxID=1513270 RepID=UPI0006B47375|nr:hypothetical protein [Marinagarivorans algicola]
MNKVEYWGKHIADWQASGLSQKEYCSQQDIKAHNLHYWRQRLSEDNAPKPKLIPVAVHRAALVRVLLKDHTIIELSSDTLAAALITLKAQGLIHVAT